MVCFFKIYIIEKFMDDVCKRYINPLDKNREVGCTSKCDLCIKTLHPILPVDEAMPERLPHAKLTATGES